MMLCMKINKNVDDKKKTLQELDVLFPVKTWRNLFITSRVDYCNGLLPKKTIRQDSDSNQNI